MAKKIKRRIDLIQALGGNARRDALSPEQRSEIASRAAKARWATEKPLRATHKGSFKEDFGIDVECYVLDDEQKTAVISQRGMAAALSISAKSGRALPRFLDGGKVAPYVGAELRAKLENPLLFQWSPVVPTDVVVSPNAIHGYDVTNLIDICKAIIKAESEGKLLDRQAHVAKQAQIILNASAKAGIQGLVYKLAGYDATRAEVVAAFKFYVREEAREYEKEFPDQLYEQWYRLYQLPRPERNRPWKFKDLTIEHVYRPLAQSQGKILELARALKAKSKQRHAKLHQFLSEVGVKALRMQVGQLTGIASVSEDQHAYERHVNKLFGKQRSFSFF